MKIVYYYLLMNNFNKKQVNLIGNLIYLNDINFNNINQPYLYISKDAIYRVVDLNNNNGIFEKFDGKTVVISGELYEDLLIIVNDIQKI